MQNKNLPQNYKGYKTEDLLKTWEDLKADRLRHSPVPKEQIKAMDQLLRDYQIAPVHQN